MLIFYNKIASFQVYMTSNKIYVYKKCLIGIEPIQNTYFNHLLCFMFWNG